MVMENGKIKKTVQFIRTILLPGLLIWLGGWLILFFLEGNDKWSEPVTNGDVGFFIVFIGGLYLFGKIIENKNKKKELTEEERIKNSEKQFWYLLEDADIIGSDISEWGDAEKAEKKEQILYRTRDFQFFLATKPDAPNAFIIPMTLGEAWDWCEEMDVDSERIWKRFRVEET